MDPKLVEKLHEDASNAYLQGDVPGALSIWREVLQEDPSDERAREGVSLCERMTGCESGSVVTTGQSPFAVGSAPTSEDSDEPTDDRDKDVDGPLDQLLEMGAPPAPPRARTVSPPEKPAAESIGNLLDLSDLSDDTDTEEGDGGFDIGELLKAPLGGVASGDSGAIPASLFDDDPIPEADADQAEPESMWHFGIGPEDPEPAASDEKHEMDFGEEGDYLDPAADEMDFGTPETPLDESAGGRFVDPPPEAFAEDVSASTLHRRVSELLATALAEMERGDRELALTTLDRLLILDDENEAAKSLQEKLSAELQSSSTESTAADKAFDSLAIEDHGDEPFDLKLGALEELGQPAELPPQPVAETSTEPELEPGIDLGIATETGAGGKPPAESFLDDPDLAFGGAAAAGGKAAKTAIPGLRALRFSLPRSRKIWVPAAAVIVLGLGFVLWQSMFAGEEAGVETGVAVSHADPGEAEPVETTPEEPVVVEPAKTAEEQLAEILQQADAALAEADYAAAIVSFNAALQLAPGDTELLRRLESAGESYRVQQDKQERWNQAVNDFGQGDYRAALAFFYRLPEEEHTESVERYIRNGWYNLGVTALKNRECDEALEHLGEARRLDSTDPGVLEAADLAVRCRREGLAAVGPLLADLTHRSLDDSP